MIGILTAPTELHGRGESPMNRDAESEFLSPGRKLRRALSRPGMLDVPGVHDGFSARAAELIGFEAVYVGGGISIATNQAIPDMGMLTTDELIRGAGAIAAVIDIPVIADLDDGGGNPLRIRRAVQQAERAGLAGFHIEDVDYSQGKHFPPKDAAQPMDFSTDRTIPIAAAVERIRAAVEARQRPDTVIIARTDQALVSVDEAIERANLFVEAGADLIYCAHVKPEDTHRVVHEVRAPIMNNVVSAAGATPEQHKMFRDAGLKVYFAPSAAPMAAYEAAWEALVAMKQSGVYPGSYTVGQGHRSKVVRHHEWGGLARRYKMTE
jgi:2-methylisocitrate lyase-like PEP mutase family enzyme